MVKERAGFRVLTPFQYPRFLFEDAKVFEADTAGEEVRKPMEDVDNIISRVTLPLPVMVATSWEGLTGRFGKDNGQGFPVQSF